MTARGADAAAVECDVGRIQRDGTGDVHQAVQGQISQVAGLAQGQAAERVGKAVVTNHQAAKAGGGRLNGHCARASEARSGGRCVVGVHHRPCTARVCGTGVAVHTSECERVRVELVQCTIAVDGVGHRHVSAVVEIERSTCANADAVGTQRCSGIAAVTHIQSTARHCGGADVALGIGQSECA